MGKDRQVPQHVADLTIVRDSGATPAETLLGLRRVEMVIVGGKIRLESNRRGNLSIHGRGRVSIDTDVAALYDEAAARLGDDLRLAGRRVRIRESKYRSAIS